MESTHSASSRGIPVNAMVLVKNAAPARMNMIMQLVRAEPARPSLKFCQVSARHQAARASAPTTPYAAHSVAVAQPATSDQQMNTIRSAQGIRLRDRYSFSRKVVGGSSAGMRSLLRTDHQAM